MTFKEAMRENGYECKTTFWDDFYIAEIFGEESIRETYDRVFREWHSNIEYVTELVLVLNHKIWNYYGLWQKNHKEKDLDMARIYDELWRKTDDWCRNHITDPNDAEYYYNALG